MNVETQHGVYMHTDCQSTWSVESLCNIHMDTNMDIDTEYIISHKETLCNIHMETKMDMDTECIINHMETLHGVYIHKECQSTWSVETLHILLYPSKICSQIKTSIYNAINSSALKGANELKST